MTFRRRFRGRTPAAARGPIIVRTQPAPRIELTVVSIVLAFLLAALLLAVPRLAAAACGTAWTSRTEPPQTILVLRTATGAVQEVNFKRYVAVVMASGEWPTTLHRAVLEAGAQAVKQYAWYYALEGNHRDGDVSPGGRCYDVRDDSRDQLFRPDVAEPTAKQLAARDALWGLSLRKRDRFFLTGYRGGTESRCAADADGWRLYARSARDCARRLDYDGVRILESYYSPGLEFVWADGTEPRTVPPKEAEPTDDAGSGASEPTDWLQRLAELLSVGADPSGDD